MAFLRSFCFLMALLTCHQLVAGTLQHAGLKGKPVLRVRAETGPLLSEKELLKDLKEHRHRRAASGLPVLVSNFTFPSESHTSGIIQYSGGDSKVIFVLMYTLNSNNLPSSSILYRSTDYGQTFSRSSLNSGVGAQHILYPSIYVAPNNNKILVFRDTLHAQIYITKDEGDTFTTQQLTPNTVNPRTILFHPTLYTHFLIHDSTNNALYYSTDLGQSLIKLSDYVSSGQYQWGVAPFDLEPTVYYNVYNPDDVNRGDFTVHLYRQVVPGNNAEEFDPSIGKHDDFLIVGRYIFIQKASSAGLATLWVSYDRNPFRMAHIPSVITHQNYIVDDIQSLQALVIVQHTNGQLNLYLSEETGQYFTLSLPDLVRGSNGVIDLELVDSINATYIANQNIGSNKRTLISFDNGGNWQLLRAPSTLTCQPPSCSLHLHMASSQYWRTGVYSQSSAPGIIIAHGTTGSSLGSNPDLYVSNDGGINWIMSLPSTWGVTVLDHGGLIVAAKDYHQQDRSSVFKYSCNEGASWSSYTFSYYKDFTIFGVITEPGETTTSVSLFGVENLAHIEWKVVQINFTTVFTGLCQSADYFWWHPWDERSSSGCLLGSRVSIQRRRPSVCCLNSRQFSRVVNYTKCACVFEDFECDYGYMHSDGVDGTCVRDSSVTLSDHCQNGVTHDTLSKGYRKVGGDVCQGGSESVYGPADTPCCSNSSTTQPTCPPTTCPSCPTPTNCPTCQPCTNPTNCPTCPHTTCPSCSTPTNCPNCPFTNIPTTCPPCSSSNTPTSYTHVTGSVAGPATSSTNVVAVVLAVLLVITVVIVIALFTVSVVLVWKLMAKGDYQAVSRNERFVFRQNSPDRVQTNLGFQGDDDDEAPLQP